MLRQREAVVAVLVVVVLLGVVPVGESTHGDSQCGRSLETIQFGTGAVGGGIFVLHGVNHVDIPYPSCTGGGFTVDHNSDTVITEQHCSEGFLRVYAPAGSMGTEAIINWASGDACA